jgi:hypothetical protein
LLIILRLSNRHETGEIVRIAVTLAVASLCSLPLYRSSTGQAANPSGSIGTRCFSYKVTHVSSTICDYGSQQPFLLKGYSKGGTSTLSYAVQCVNRAFWPTRRRVIDRKVWYRHSLTVRGNFKVYGRKTTLRASRHCSAAEGKAALLTVRLRMTRRVTTTNLVVRLDSTLPWGR